MDKAYVGSCHAGQCRADVFLPEWDRVLEKFKDTSAQHLGSCAPAVFGSGGARFAGTLADGSKLHCRFNVKVPLFDQAREQMSK